MDERILKWLYDIQQAITEIDSYFSEHPKDFSYYASNVLLKRAIERDLKIIGFPSKQGLRRSMCGFVCGCVSVTKNCDLHTHTQTHAQIFVFNVVLSLSFYVFLSKRTDMFIDNYKSQIKILCKENKVKDLFVFGSVLTANFNENSDIDFIVDIDSSDPIDYADHYFALKFSLEDLLKRPVDLLESKAIKNPFLLQQIEQTKALVYGTGN